MRDSLQPNSEEARLEAAQKRKRDNSSEDESYTNNKKGGIALGCQREAMARLPASRPNSLY
jgi:hypothetical protein